MNTKTWNLSLGAVSVIGNWVFAQLHGEGAAWTPPHVGRLAQDPTDDGPIIALGEELLIRAQTRSNAIPRINKSTFDLEDHVWAAELYASLTSASDLRLLERLNSGSMLIAVGDSISLIDPDLRRVLLHLDYRVEEIGAMRVATALRITRPVRDVRQDYLEHVFFDYLLNQVDVLLSARGPEADLELWRMLMAGAERHNAPVAALDFRTWQRRGIDEFFEGATMQHDFSARYVALSSLGLVLARAKIPDGFFATP